MTDKADINVYKNASDEDKAAVEQMAGGEATPEDMEIAKVISNMAMDVTQGNKEDANIYLHKIVDAHPTVARLMVRVGMTLAKAEIAVKQ